MRLSAASTAIPLLRSAVVEKAGQLGQRFKPLPSTENTDVLVIQSPIRYTEI